MSCFIPYMVFPQSSTHAVLYSLQGFPQSSADAVLYSLHGFPAVECNCDTVRVELISRDTHIAFTCPPEPRAVNRGSGPTSTAKKDTTTCGNPMANGSVCLNPWTARCENMSTSLETPSCRAGTDHRSYVHAVPPRQSPLARIGVLYGCASKVICLLPSSC